MKSRVHATARRLPSGSVVVQPVRFPEVIRGTATAGTPTERPRIPAPDPHRSRPQGPFGDELRIRNVRGATGVGDRLRPGFPALVRPLPCIGCVRHPVSLAPDPHRESPPTHLPRAPVPPRPERAVRLRPRNRNWTPPGRPAARRGCEPRGSGRRTDEGSGGGRMVRWEQPGETTRRPLVRRFVALLLLVFTAP